MIYHQYTFHFYFFHFVDLRITVVCIQQAGHNRLGDVSYLDLTTPKCAVGFFEGEWVTISKDSQPTQRGCKVSKNIVPYKVKFHLSGKLLLI